MNRSPLILLLETSTKICSVSVTRGSEILSSTHSEGYNDHAANITLHIKNACEEAGIELSELNAIAVSNGPGSYTGLRIGLSTAKGLCYSMGLPLITVDTLSAFAHFLKDSSLAIGPNDLVCAMMDARRMEVFMALYDSSLQCVQAPEAVIVDESFLEVFIENGRKIYLVGDGAEKTRSTLESRQEFVWVDGFKPSARLLQKPALQLFETGSFSDLAYSEPFYLKEYIAAAPKVKGLQ